MQTLLIFLKRYQFDLNSILLFMVGKEIYKQSLSHQNLI